MRFLFKLFLKLFLFVFIIALLAAGGGAYGLYYLIVEEPCPEMEPEYIASILGRESPVYYRDGKEKIGVLFQDFHRQYLAYNEIPQNFVQALVASEDDQFFTHYGVDIPGIIRAMIANYQAGRIVQGGSTISQQTAKNLFKRDERSYQAKLKELLYALRLEHRYSKEKILEFYANQFYVSGNGHGIGVAARYYFDKDPADLNLLEAAFIAGSVKRPNYYNPFIKKNKMDARNAQVRADERARYVLGKMLKQGVITPAEYAASVESDIVFNRGKTSFALNTIMDLVKDGLSTDVITKALEDHGISNISTSGAKVISTIDQTLQQETLYSLRRDLSRLDVRLRGYEREELLQEYKNLVYKGDGEIKEKAFIFGNISAIAFDAKNPEKTEITIQFGAKQPDGYIDRAGLERMLVALVKFRKQKWAKPEKKDLAELISRLQLGDKIYVSVRETDLFDGTPTLDLERYPKIQGAAMVMQHGMIRAMAGGMENRFYNRAVFAKRLMGSTFKPFLFSAALQLGWTPIDKIDNKRNVFIYMNQAYFPRPDHKSPFNFVSMSWAGVKSENVAAVWLLYHLTDRLTPSNLRELARYLDMAPRNEPGKKENYQHFRMRIRDRFGININKSTIDRAAYEQAIKNLEADFLFDNRAAEYQLWKRLPYGHNFNTYRARLSQLRKRNTNLKQEEFNRRYSMLRYNYLALKNVHHSLLQYRQYLDKLSSRAQDPLAYFDTRSVERPTGSLVEDEQGRLIFTFSTRLPKNWLMVGDTDMRLRLQGLWPDEADAVWNNILLGGKVSATSFDQVQRQVAVERTALSSRKPYSMEVLASVSDYRVMLGLQYLIKLARESGVNSKLDPVLSFTLGSNVVSLSEIVRMYETMVTGNSYVLQQPESEEESNIYREDQDGLSIIDRIQTPDGTIIYSRQSTATPVYDAKTSNTISNILQNVVHYGTGRYARKNVRLHSNDEDRESEMKKLDLVLPLLGKTGTANDFRNAAFIGYVPTGLAPEGAALTLSPGYTVGVYSGFDENDPMKKGSTRISGSQGALPTWSSIAEAVYKMEGVADHLDPVDLVFNGISLKYPDSGQQFIPVNHKGGGIVINGAKVEKTLMPPEVPAVLSHGHMSADNQLDVERNFRPFWFNQR